MSSRKQGKYEKWGSEWWRRFSRDRKTFLLCVPPSHPTSVWFLFSGSSTPSLLIVFHQIFAFSPGLSSSNPKWRRISTRSIHRNGLSPAEILKATAPKVKRTTHTAYVNMFEGFCKHHNVTNRRSTSDGCLSLWKRSFLMWCKMENGSCPLDVQVKYVRMEMTCEGPEGPLLFQF